MERTSYKAMTFAVAIAVSIAPAPPIAAQTPAGPEFQVNTYTTSIQQTPAVSVEDNGDFVVVWSSYGTFSGTDFDFSIQGQRFEPGGTSVGGQFRVNTVVDGNQKRPAVATDSSGSFVVVWDSYDSGGGSPSTSIEGQRFAGDGSAMGNQFQINTYTSGFPVQTDVAADPDGNFVVVWQAFDELGSDSLSYSVRGQRYSGIDGTPVGSHFLVNTYTTSHQKSPRVAMAPDDGFVVVWQSYGSGGDDSSGYSVQGQRFGSNGALLGSQFQINSYTPAGQQYPSVSFDQNGGFVVVWANASYHNGDFSGTSIQGQRFASDGSPNGTDFLVNEFTTGNQLSPEIAVEADGGFVVVWESDAADNGDSSYTSVQGRRFANDASPVGAQFLVNSYTFGFQGYSLAVDMNTDGDFVVIWDGGRSGSGSPLDMDDTVLGQRFVNPLFADGFETGDTTLWDSVSP